MAVLFGCSVDTGRCTRTHRNTAPLLFDGGNAISINIVNVTINVVYWLFQLLGMSILYCDLLSHPK